MAKNKAAKAKKPDLSKIEIHLDDETALPRFAWLNAQWIKELHEMEASDKAMVAHPEIYIEGENHVLSAHINGVVAGAVALKKDKKGQYELTKMAVDKAYQGYGIGQILMDACESYAKNSLGLSSLYLLSNTRNAAAIRLYKRGGWSVFHEGPHPVYARANIGLKKNL